MNNIECALKILEDKGHILIEKLESKNKTLKRCPEYKMTVLSGHRLSKKILEIFRNSDEYRHEYYANEEIHFTKIKEVEKWLELECQKEETQVIHISSYISKWIKKYTKYHQSSDCNGYLVINEEKRKKRIENEENKKQEALDLLEKIL